MFTTLSDLVLEAHGGVKAGENCQKHKEVVDGQHFFEDVSRKPNDGWATPTKAENKAGKDEGEADPHEAPHDGLGQHHNLSTARLKGKRMRSALGISCGARDSDGRFRD
jgi:hypothetical protein